jgi:hypothetical protein
MAWIGLSLVGAANVGSFVDPAGKFWWSGAAAAAGGGVGGGTTSTLSSAVSSFFSSPASFWEKEVSPAPCACACAVTLVLLLLFLVRGLFDCLVHWTGAAPAEHFSTAKRPAYRHYQATVPVLFPFFMAPWMDPKMIPGWPALASSAADKKES